MFLIRSQAEGRGRVQESRAKACKKPLSLQPSQQGFSLLEMTIAVAIMLVVAGMATPRILQAVEVQRLQGAAHAYASFLQESRYRAEQDGQWYEILLDQTNPNYTIAYLDINGDGVRQATEPAVQIAQPITVPDPVNAAPAIPAGFGNANLLGATPLTVDTKPATWNQLAQAPGLAFNERGLPCQRASVTSPCTNATQVMGAGNALVAAPTAWVTYLASPTSNGGTLYAAITVTPAGRIKVWNYQAAAGGGGSWQ